MKKIDFRLASLLCGATFAMVCATIAQDFAIPITVAEPAGVARAADPACGGIPFFKGQVKDVNSLALFTKDGQPVPAQFSKLAPYEDDSVQWALVDTLVKLDANGKMEFVVKTGKAALPSMPLKINETEANVTIDTGAAVFTVNKKMFNLLESVAVKGKKVAGPGSIEITDVTGKLFKANAPTRVSWEYNGPVRATLRVDGDYFAADGAKLISYTSRLSFWTGSAQVRVEHNLRNSDPLEGNDVKIKSASVALQAKGSELGKGRGFIQIGNNDASLIVSHRHTGGAFPGYNPDLDRVDSANDKIIAWVVPEVSDSTAKLLGYGTENDANFFVLADCAHKNSRIWFDFAPAGNGPERHQALLSNLHMLADGAWIADTGCMGYGKFGTLADEIASYKKWGWKGFDDPKKQGPIHKKSDSYAYIGKEEIHDESEADNAELALLMYLRTGERGWFDQGEAWARYLKSHYGFRTDGFEYDGFRHSFGPAEKKSKRPCKGLSFGWYGPKQYGWSGSRLCWCHFWGNGVFDYYCLTGDVDALEGGIDLAEYARMSAESCISGKSLQLTRAWGRNFQCAVRAYQVTRESQWREAADRFAQFALKAPNRRTDGLFPSYNELTMSIFIGRVLKGKKDPRVAPRLEAYMKEHGLTFAIGASNAINISNGNETWQVWETAQSFEFGACCDAFARYAAATDNKEVKKLVVDMASGTRDIYWSQKCNHPIPHPFVGMPTKDKTYDPGLWEESHDNCPNDPGGVHNGYDARNLTDIFSRAYTLSGDKQWLDWAKRCWDRGSKRPYQSKAQGTPADEVAMFAGTTPPNAAGIDIRNCLRLFYETARQDK